MKRYYHPKLKMSLSANTSLRDLTGRILVTAVSIVFLTFNFTQSQILIPKENNKLGIGRNFRIYPSIVTQTEVLSAVHPLNSEIIFSSANTINFSPFFVSEGIYVSTDGGITWTGNDTLTGANIQFHGGDPGITIDKNGTFILTRLGRTPFNGLYSHFSTDNGRTWSNQKTVTLHDLERASLASDGNPLSSFYGRTYAVWVRFAPPYPIYFSSTDDGASTWSSPVQINNPTQRCAGGDILIGSNGKVHVCWAVVKSVSPFTEIFTGYASSTDGGMNWSVTENAFPMNGIQGLLPQKQNIRVNSLPKIAIDTTGGPRHGWIYIVTSQKNFSPAGSDPDIILNRSTNGGVTWSSGIRVNQDAVNNGKIQYFPAIHVDRFGGVNVIYYDDRNTTSDSTGLFLSRSVDGGDTWKDFEISDHNFNPIPIGGLGQGYQGDNISLTSSKNILLPFWMDNSSGIYQIWTAPVDLTTVGLDNEKINIPVDIHLEQNFPNPFSAKDRSVSSGEPSTSIKFQIPTSGRVTLKVYDMLGREVKTLIDDYKTVGSYQVEFNLRNGEVNSNLSSGVYLYRLTFEDSDRNFRVQSISKKMLLLR